MNWRIWTLPARIPCLVFVGAALAVVYGCDSKTDTVGTYDDCVLEHSKSVNSAAVLSTIKTSCKQKYPKVFDFAAIAKSANVRDWTEVARMDEVRALSDQEKNAARKQYFFEVVQPRIHPDFVAEARTQFYSFARGVERQVDKATTPQAGVAIKPAALKSRPKTSSAQSAALPLPINGQLFPYSSRQRVAPFSIVTRGDDRHFFVKLEEWSSGQPVVGVFVRAGQSVDVKIPLGTYRLKYAAGIAWYGDQELFGDNTTYYKADKQFQFATSGGQVAGYTVELFLQPNGNLKTTHIGKVNW